MGGFGIGEVLLIGLIVGFIGVALLAGVSGFGRLNPGQDPGVGMEAEARLRREVEELRRRVQALEDAAKEGDQSHG